MALRNLTLDRLLLWTGCGILAVFFLPVSLVALWQLPKEKENGLLEKTRLVAEGVADAVTEPLLTNDTYSVSLLLRDAIGDEETFRYALIIDGNGEIPAHTFDRGVPKELYEYLQSSAARVKRFRSPAGSLLDVSSPVLNGRVGTVHLGASRDEVAKTQRRILWTALAMLATALALMLAGVRWVSLLVSRPLATLERSTKELVDRDAAGAPALSPGGTAEVRSIAARFLELLHQMSALESLLPPPQRKAFRERKDHVVAGIVKPEAADSEEVGDGIWSETYLRQRSSWLVFHRWIAIGGILIAWLIYLSLGLEQSSVIPVIACVLVMCAWNGFLQLRGRWPPLLTRRPLRFWLTAQIVSDLVALTVLLHLFGGMENPFKLFYVFLMVIAGLTFHIRMSVRLAVFGSAIYAAMIFFEMASYLPHYPLFPAIGSGVWSQPYLVLGEAVGMTIVQLGVVFFVHTVTARRQEAETAAKAAEKIAFSRERMAMLGEMAAGVAHEIRNPIHGLLNCCSLLREKTRSVEESGELLNLLEEGLRRVSSISDRLLRLSQAGDMRKGAVDMETVVGSTTGLVRESARKKGIAIEIRVDEDIPLIEGDADRLAEAVLNLLNNSLDACEGGEKITLSLEREKDPWDSVRLVVRDTGEGIPAEVLPRIFDVFFTTKAVGQGSGLGLALVQETVRMHGGIVEVQSAPGEGTAVTILLPVKESE